MTPTRKSDPAEVRLLLLDLGVALTMTDDAVSEVQGWLRAIAAAYGYGHARISVFPTLVVVVIGDDEPAGLRTIDSFAALRLDQASDVIRLARRAGKAEIDPHAARAELERIPRHTPALRGRGEHCVARRGDGRARPGHPPGRRGPVGVPDARCARGRDEGVGGAVRGWRLPAGGGRRGGRLRHCVPRPRRKRSRVAAPRDPAARHVPAGRAADDGDRRSGGG